MRRQFLIGAILSILLVSVGSLLFQPILWSLIIFVPIWIMGFSDFFQKKHTIRRNFPILGRFRYWFEAIRPEINQYFIESNTDGAPFSREQRSLVYQRAKRELDTLPFGTQWDVYQVGYEFVQHSIMPKEVHTDSLRVKVGGKDCKQPYSASILNISAMSYGSLSGAAVLALNGAAKDGKFAHNTGEGGISPYHLEPGGDLIWQIGTGYFGCRTPEGKFSEEEFVKRANLPVVKMIELKLSQGAKPGHGGILPARKVTKEISEIRGVPMGQDVVSPPAHSAFSTPIEMLYFIRKLRTLANGKPIGFKLCLGKHREFLALCKAMLKTGILPDFITVDGGEGGTGAAPLEFSNYVGTPGVDGIVFIHNALVGYGLRDQLKIFSTGKITTGFKMIQRLAIGADVLYAARPMLLAIGCIQALRCNSNLCPTGVTTQDPNLTVGLVPAEKRKRAAIFHEETLKSFAHLIGAMGLSSTTELKPWHLLRRVSAAEIKNYWQIYDYVKPGILLEEGTENTPKMFYHSHRTASPETFDLSIGY